MKNWILRKIAIIALAFFVAFIMEASIYWIIYHRFFAEHYFPELAFFIILFAPACIFYSNKYTISYCSIILGMMSILYMLNLTLHFNSKDIFSFEYITLAGEATTVFEWSYLNPSYILILLIFIAIYVGGLLCIYKFIPVEEENLPKRYIPRGVYFAILFLALGFSTALSSMKRIEKENSTVDIYQNKSGFEIIQYTSSYLKKSSLKKYGLFSYAFSELSYLSQKDSQSGDVSDIVDPTLEPDELNVTSDYSGLLKGMNVIEIMVETGADYFIDENLTPTLYKLSSEGINFTNNHSKNKTNISEYIGFAGSVHANIAYMNIENQHTLPYLLGQNGYETSYFHNNYGDFYKRENVIRLAGFENAYFSLDINPDRQWNNNYDGLYPLDSDTMDDIIDELAPKEYDKPYYHFFTSLSTHGPYNNDKNYLRLKEKDYIKKIELRQDLGLWKNPCDYASSEVQRQYMILQAEMMDLDYAVEKLYNRLVEQNQIDNTLIILYGDHEPYYKVGINKPLKEYIFNCEDESYSPQYSTMQFFYNPKLTSYYKEKNGFSYLEKAEIKDFTSPYVIVPSVLELMGVHYDSRYYVGTSIFQTTTGLDNIFYSHELGSIFTDKIYSIDLTSHYLWKDPEVSDAYKAIYLAKSKELMDKIAKINSLYLMDLMKNTSV